MKWFSLLLISILTTISFHQVRAGSDDEESNAAHLVGPAAASQSVRDSVSSAESEVKTCDPNGPIHFSKLPNDIMTVLGPFLKPEEMARLSQLGVIPYKLAALAAKDLKYLVVDCKKDVIGQLLVFLRNGDRTYKFQNTKITHYERAYFDKSTHRFIALHFPHIETCYVWRELPLIETLQEYLRKPNGILRTENPYMKKIEMGARNLRPEEVAWLVDHFPNLESLHIGGALNYLDEETRLTVVAHLKKLKNLKSLNIGGNLLSPRIAEAIADNLKSLTDLQVAGSNINASGALAIAHGLESLTSLDISSNFIGDEAMIEFAQLSKKLVSLRARSSRLGITGVTAIANHLSHLTSLDLSDNRLGPDAIKAFTSELKKVVVLKLSQSPITEEGVAIIVADLPLLRELDLESTHLTVRGLELIAQGIRSLTKLNLARNSLGDAGALAIADPNALPSLKEVDLFSNNIGDQGALALAQHPKKLHVLKLGRGISPATQTVLKKKFAGKTLLIW